MILIGQKIQSKQPKTVKDSHHKIFIFLCMYKMVDINAKTWIKSKVSVNT